MAKTIDEVSNELFKNRNLHQDEINKMYESELEVRKQLEGLDKRYKEEVKAFKEQLRKKFDDIEETLRNTIKNKEDYINKLYEEQSSWVDLLKYIAEELVAEHYRGCDSYEILGPFGLGCHTSIWLLDSKLPKENDSNISQIVGSFEFEPGKFENTFDLLVFTGETKDKYGQNTIDELNGFNKVFVKCPSTIEELKKFDLHK